MKLLNNLYLAFWAAIQWAIFLAFILPILGCYFALLAFAFEPMMWLYSLAWLVFAVTCWTYRHSGFFWATPLPLMGSGE